MGYYHNSEGGERGGMRIIGRQWLSLGDISTVESIDLSVKFNSQWRLGKGRWKNETVILAVFFNKLEHNCKPTMKKI